MKIDTGRFYLVLELGSFSRNFRIDAVESVFESILSKSIVFSPFVFPKILKIFKVKVTNENRYNTHI